ncbi:MAG: hypothetical protein AABX16_01825 [Nanoarchaeota archaeon]
MKKYGVLAILLIILVEINFFFKIEPFASWYFPIVWFSYILLVDALVYKIRKHSLINNHLFHFLGLFILSAFFWYIFEFLNIFVQNWSYIGTENLGNMTHLFKFISFSTVLPALFETTMLLQSIHLFDHYTLKRKHNLSKSFLYTMMLFGALCFFLPFFLPTLTFPLIWISFFLLLDPINYLHQQPSIISHIKERKLALPLSLLLSGIILGFFWEFWNYWAVIKWTYQVPYIGFFKIFEMPLLGYFGYFPFAFELYAMYWFVRSLFTGKDKSLL